MGRGVVVVVISSKLQEVAPQMQIKTFGSNGGQVGLAVVVVVINSKLSDVAEQMKL